MLDKIKIDIETQQLLSAYLDGELGVTQRAAAEANLRENPQAAELLESWRQNSIGMRALPKHRLDDGFAKRVLQNVDQSVIDDPSILVFESNSPIRRSENRSENASNEIEKVADTVDSIVAITQSTPDFDGSTQTPQSHT